MDQVSVKVPIDEDWFKVAPPTGTVYVLKLEQGKYYVGHTERDVSLRINEHFATGGSAWTMKYKPVQVLFVKQCSSVSDEDTLTLETMKKYGWWNVRGGRWCQVNMQHPPPELFQEPQTTWSGKLYTAIGNLLYHNEPHRTGHAEGSCFRCGGMGHWAKDCKSFY